MGFNNGYDSGYEDAKAELEPKVAALEKRVKELEASGGGGSGNEGPGSVAGVVVPLSQLRQIVPAEGVATYDTTKVSQVTLAPGSDDLPTIVMGSSTDLEYFFIVDDNVIASMSNDGFVIADADEGGSFRFTLDGPNSPGVYQIVVDPAIIVAYLHKVTDLAALQGVPLAS